MTIATRNGGRARPCLSNFLGTVAYTDVKSLYKLPKFNVHPDWHARGMPMACILYQSRRDMANDTLVKLNCLVLSVIMPECLIKMRALEKKHPV